MSKPRELFIIQDDFIKSGLDCCVVYVSRQTPTDLVFREVLPDSIQGEKIFELQKERDEAIKHCNEWMDNFVREKNLVKDAAKFCEHLETTISTLTAKVKRYEEVFNEIIEALNYLYDRAETEHQEKKIQHQINVIKAALNDEK